MFSAKTPHGTSLRFITSITIKQQWLTLDHWACPLNNSPKGSGGFKMTAGQKKAEWNHKKILWPLFIDGIQLLQD